MRCKELRHGWRRAAELRLIFPKGIAIQALALLGGKQQILEYRAAFAPLIQLPPAARQAARPSATHS
jgi:hypothetical protein